MNSGRPDIAAALDPDEDLLWQGHPKPGRPSSSRSNLIAAGLYAVTFALLFLAWWLEVFHSGSVARHLLAYGFVGTAAFTTFLGLRFSILDRRRARNRDAHTAYGLTNRRALAQAGPYRAELPLNASAKASLTGDNLTLTNGETRLRFERLKDAKTAHALALKQIGAEE